MTGTAQALECVRLLIPVKRLAWAKTRLSPDGSTRRAAAELLFARTLRIATTCVAPHQVCVVTADETVARRANAAGADILLDRGTDLNSALHAAIAELAQRAPGATVVVLVADLPRLRADELRLGLDDAARSGVPRHVADHHGTGTTFVSIPPGAELPMVFGTGSAQRFAGLGSVPMTLAPRGLRTDLDTPTDPYQIDHRIREEAS